MDGKVVLISGATDGIGKATAMKLASMGAHLVIMGRNPSKTDSTLREIRSQTGNSNVDKIVADLSSLSEMRKAADIFNERYDRLDVLINNAAGSFSSRRLTVDGYDMTLALNHLNYFLLTNLLLDVLKHTAEANGEARIVNVSSDAHFRCSGVNLDDINKEKSFPRWGLAYAESKLMNILFSYELARQLEGTGVTANALHPGVIATNIGMDNPGIMGTLYKFAQQMFAKPPEVGAETPVYLATSPEVKGVTGKYFANRTEKQSNKASYDVEAQKRLWQISEELTFLKEIQ